MLKELYEIGSRLYLHPLMLDEALFHKFPLSSVIFHSTPCCHLSLKLMTLTKGFLVLQQNQLAFLRYDDHCRSALCGLGVYRQIYTNLIQCYTCSNEYTISENGLWQWSCMRPGDRAKNACWHVKLTLQLYARLHLTWSHVWHLDIMVDPFTRFFVKKWL